MKCMARRLSNYTKEVNEDVTGGLYYISHDGAAVFLTCK